MKRNSPLTCLLLLLLLMAMASGCVVRTQPVHHPPPLSVEAQNSPPPDYQYNQQPGYQAPPPAYQSPQAPPPAYQSAPTPPPAYQSQPTPPPNYQPQPSPPPPPPPPPPPQPSYQAPPPPPPPPPPPRYQQPAPPPPAVGSTLTVTAEFPQVKRGSELRLFLNMEVPVSVYFNGRLVTKKVNAASRRILTVNVPTDVASGYWEVEYNGQRARTQTITIYP